MFSNSIRTQSIRRGTILTGVVQKVMPYGAFISVEPGMDGLLHVCRMEGRSRDERDAALSALQEGQRVKVEVTSKPGSRRIELNQNGLQRRQALRRLNIGDIIKGAVVSVANYGVFIKVGPGVEGLLHVSKLAGYRDARDKALANLKPGHEVEVLVESIESEDGRTKIALAEYVSEADELDVFGPELDRSAGNIRAPGLSESRYYDTIIDGVGSDDEEVEEDLGERGSGAIVDVYYFDSRRLSAEDGYVSMADEVAAADEDRASFQDISGADGDDEEADYDEETDSGDEADSDENEESMAE